MLCVVGFFIGTALGRHKFTWHDLDAIHIEILHAFALIYCNET